jgi:hypothetical protein
MGFDMAIALVPLRQFTAIIAAATLLTAFSLPQASAASYDTVIANGRVMDPDTGLDAVRNLGIADGRIAAISSKRLTGRRTIDAHGLVVAPGFIDLHSHAMDPLSNVYQAHDGVTTALELELGVYPVGKWYESMAGKMVINYGATVSQSAKPDGSWRPSAPCSNRPQPSSGADESS